MVELERLVGMRDFGWGDSVNRVTRSAVNYINLGPNLPNPPLII